LADGEGLRGGPTADLVPVFMEGDVPHVMGPVLDPPVAPIGPEQDGRVGQRRAGAGDRVGDLVLGLDRLPLPYPAPPPLHSADLLQVRPAQVGVELRVVQRPEAALLAPPMARLGLAL